MTSKVIISKEEVDASIDYELEKRDLLITMIKSKLKKYTGKYSGTQLSNMTGIGTSSITRIKNGTESMSLKKIESYIELLKNL